jgi:hypothetical protein
MPKPKLEDQEIVSLSDPYSWTILVRVAIPGTLANTTGAHKVMQSLEEPVTLRSTLIISSHQHLGLHWAVCCLEIF